MVSEAALCCGTSLPDTMATARATACIPTTVLGFHGQWISISVYAKIGLRANVHRATHSAADVAYARGTRRNTLTAQSPSRGRTP